MGKAIDFSKVDTQALIAELTARSLAMADEGIACAVECAGEGWMEKILPEFRHWIARRRTWFAIEDFRLYVENHHPELIPESNKAWGALPREAKKQALITAHGYRHAISPRTHGHPVRLYARAA